MSDTDGNTVSKNSAIDQTGTKVSSQKLVIQNKTSENKSKMVNGATNNRTVKEDKNKNNKKAEEASEEKGSDAEAWSQNQQVILEWALKQYPKTTEQRWEKIAEHIPGKNKVYITN